MLEEVPNKIEEEETDSRLSYNQLESLAEMNKIASNLLVTRAYDLTENRFKPTQKMIFERYQSFLKLNKVKESPSGN